MARRMQAEMESVRNAQAPTMHTQAKSWLACQASTVHSSNATPLLISICPWLPLFAIHSGESARGGSVGSSRSFGFGLGVGGGSDIDEDELTRLKLAQFAQREAICQTNNEGEFAPKRAPAAVTGGSSGSSSSGSSSRSSALKLDHSHRKVSDKPSSSSSASGRRSKGSSGAGAGAGAGASSAGGGGGGGGGGDGPLSPMARIARDRRVFLSSGPNRVASRSEEELLAAQQGPAAVRALHKKKKR